MRQEIPFNITLNTEVPSYETLLAIQEGEEIRKNLKDVKTFENISDLMKDLKSE